MTYLTLKYIHLLSMVLLFGTGLGSAFYKWMADRSRNVIHISIVNRHVVLADWLFTTPTVLIQPVTGIWMLYLIHIPLTTSWVVISLLLYALAGLCWLPVVWLQIRMQKLAQLAVEQNTDLDNQYWRYARIWFYLGIPAFIAMVLIVLLMVMKFSFGV
jgi:uncharacterized membrane protein